MAKITSEQKKAVSHEKVSIEVKFVQLRSIENFTIHIDETTLVHAVKCQLELQSGIPAELVQLYYKGERLVSFFTSVLQTSGLDKENIIMARMSQDWEYFIKTCIKSENYQAVRRRSRVKMQMLTQEDRIFVNSFVAARHSNSALLFGILPCNQSISRATELSKRNILHAAVQGGDQSCIVNILMNGGGTLIDQEDINGVTPLSMAKNMPGIVDMLKAYSMMIKQNTIDIQYDQPFDYSDDGDFESSDSEKETTAQTEDSQKHTAFTTNDDVITDNNSISSFKIIDVSGKNVVTVSDDITLLKDVNDGRESGGDSGYERTNDGNTTTFGTSTHKTQTESISGTRLATPVTSRRSKHSANYQRRRKMGMPSLLMSAKSQAKSQALGHASFSSTSELSCSQTRPFLQLSSSSPDSLQQPPTILQPTFSCAVSTSPTLSSSEHLLQQPKPLTQTSLSQPNHLASSSSAQSALHQPPPLPQSSVSPNHLVSSSSSEHLLQQLPTFPQSSVLSPSYIASSSSTHLLQQTPTFPQSSLSPSDHTVCSNLSPLSPQKPQTFPQSSVSPPDQSLTIRSDEAKEPTTEDKLNDMNKTDREKLLPKPPKCPVPAGRRRVTNVKYLNVEDRSSPFRQRSLSTPYAMETRLLSRERTRTRVLSESSAIGKDGETKQLPCQIWLRPRGEQTRIKTPPLPAGKEKWLNYDAKQASSQPGQRIQSLLSTKDDEKRSFLEQLDSEKQNLSHRKHKHRGKLLEALGQLKVGRKNSTTTRTDRDKSSAQKIAKTEQKNTSHFTKKKSQRSPVPGHTFEIAHERIKTLNFPMEKGRRLSLGSFAKRNQKSTDALPIPQVKERRYSLGGPLRTPKNGEASSLGANGEGEKRKYSSLGSSEAFKTWLHKKDEEALERDIQLLSEVLSRSNERKVIGTRDGILAKLKISSNRPSEKHKK